MALATATPFASFDITDGSQIRDISAVLSEAIYLDYNLLSEGVTMGFDDPVGDTTFYWNEEALNSNQTTISGALTSIATSMVLATGHGARVHVGDLGMDTVINSTEVFQATAISTDTVTVVRAFNSTVAAAIADAATIVWWPGEQEGSDIQADKTVKPVVRNNFTQIFGGKYELLISGSQRARRMATIALDVQRQLGNRAIEMRRDMSVATMYGEKSASSGSDTVYRYTLGLRGWARDNGGVVNTTSQPLVLSNVNSINTTLVNLGKYANTLVIGTDLVNTIASIDSSNRRLYESEKQAGYTVTQLLLAQGNLVNVIVDGRVKTGDAFLYDKNAVSWHPLDGRAMFTIAATDFADAVKRRILGEWGLLVRNPEAVAYMRNKT